MSFSAAAGGWLEMVGDPRPLGRAASRRRMAGGPPSWASLGSMLNGIELPDG